MTTMRKLNSMQEEHSIESLTKLKNNNPLISIIMPFYNGRFDLLHDAVCSVLAQSYSKWELVIVNDGSNVESTSLLKNYILRINDKRISVIYLDKNYGPSKARNIGVENSKGEIITFLDADDLLLPWHLENIVQSSIENPGKTILSTDYIYYLRLSKVRKLCLVDTFSNIMASNEKLNYTFERIKAGKQTLFPQLSLKREVFKMVHFDTNFNVAEDREFRLQILDHEDLMNSTIILPFASYLYRFYPSKGRQSHKINFAFPTYEQILNKYKNRSPVVKKRIKEMNLMGANCETLSQMKKYLSQSSTLEYLQALFQDIISLKGKLRNIKEIAMLSIRDRILIPLFGVDFRYFNLLFNIKNNKYQYFKKLFQDYLKIEFNSPSRYYAKKCYERIFN